MRHESANLDLLRTIAVALVVVNHVGVVVGWDQQQVLQVGAIGRAGVAIFFVHTAYVLMQSLERRQESALAFFVRRAFRIYPLSVATVMFTAGILVLSGGQPDLGALMSNLLLVQNITGHGSAPESLWTLPYEVQMYVVLPALYAVTKTSRPVLKIAAVWLASLAVAASGSFPLLVYMPCFMAGTLAFTLRDFRRLLSPWVLFAAVGTAAVCISLLEAQGQPEEPMLWALCAGLCGLLPFTREVTQGWLAKLGSVGARYSYSVYLTHMFALIAGFALASGPAVLKCAVAAVILAIFVRVTDQWIEQPGIDLGRRLAARVAKRQRASDRTRERVGV